jgi:hypothetical protein
MLWLPSDFEIIADFRENNYGDHSFVGLFCILESSKRNVFAAQFMKQLSQIPHNATALRTVSAGNYCTRQVATNPFAVCAAARASP